jgi:protein-S-isoprenylcysteine O-methyltransferase Ste14
VTLPPPFVWPQALVFWIAYAWAFYLEFALTRRARHSSRMPQSVDSGSFRLAYYTVQLATLAAFAVAMIPAVGSRASLPRAWFWAGIALMIAGSGLRRYCMRTLGIYFTGDVQIVAGQRIIDTGPYRWVRHPSYTGALLLLAGIGLALLNGLSVAILVVIPGIAYGYRMIIEERALTKQFGEEYTRYARGTKRLIPFIF